MPDSPKPSGTTVTHEMARETVLGANERTLFERRLLAYISEQEAAEREHANLARVVGDLPIECLPRLSEALGQGGPRLPVCIHCGMAAPEHGPNCLRPKTIREATDQHCEPGRDFRVDIPHKLMAEAEKRAETAELEVERLRAEFSAMCSEVFRLPVPTAKAPEAWAREQAERMSRNFDNEIAEHQRHHDEEPALVEQARQEGYERGKREPCPICEREDDRS